MAGKRIDMFGHDKMKKKGYHIWPKEMKPHPVGKRHKGAPKGAKHWNKSEFMLGNSKYKEGK